MGASLTAAIAFNVSMRSRHRGMEARYHEERKTRQRRQNASDIVDLRDTQSGVDLREIRADVDLRNGP